MDLTTPALLDRDWFGAPLPGAPRWALALEGPDLVLRGACDAPPVRVPGDRPGGFHEGLWEGDVVELFLLNPATGWYLEFNLAPGGGWWACGHTAPRVRVAGGAAPLEGARTRMVAREQGWDCTLRVPVASLPADLAFDPAMTRANLTFCLGNPQRYATLADLGGGDPDFHRPSLWLALGDVLGFKG